jgi:hypothetical protein
MNQYQFDLAQLASDLRVPISMISRLSRELGCRTGSKKENNKAMLQLPLQFPKKTR